MVTTKDIDELEVIAYAVLEQATNSYDWFEAHSHIVTYEILRDLGFTRVATQTT
jgi:hypothetical protein